MPFLNVKNRAASTLASGITDVATSLTVAAGEGTKFPATNFNITIEDEILLCSSRTNDVLTVVRAQEGTANVAHDAAKTVELRITAKIITDIQRGGASINVQSLTGDKTLTPGTDQMYQYLAPTANRIVTLATAGAIAGDRFVIRHNSAYDNAYYLQIKQDATELDKIYASAIREFIFDGTNWISGGIGAGENDSKSFDLAIGRGSSGYNYGLAIGRDSNGYQYGIAIGRAANGYEYGVAVGRDSGGYTYGVGIGKDASGYNYGVGIGYGAYGYNSGVALGAFADANNMILAIALGRRSQCRRYGELAKCADNVATPLRLWNIVSWFGDTANATPVEVFLDNSSARYTLLNSSAVAFKLLVVARDNVAGEAGAYLITGLIKRGANAAATAIVGTPTITVIAEDDASWDIAVSADTTNGSLKITVTGDATNATRWEIRGDMSEVRF